MPQINLLKQTHNPVSVGELLPSILVKVLAVILLLVLGYYGWLYVQTKKVSAEIVNIQGQISQSKSQIAGIERRDELFVRQSQLKTASQLVENHVYWAALFPELARVTLKTASYRTMRVLSDGSINLSVIVPNYQELDKFLQVFDLPEYNKNFSDIKIGSVGKSQEAGLEFLTFDIQFKYSTELLKQKK